MDYSKTSEGQVIGPILLQRQCDACKGDMEPAEWAKIIAGKLNGEGPWFLGCGTRFRWWWGSSAQCPSCGRVYMSDLDSLKRYRVEQEKTCQT
jgi:hypothetical protein